MMAGSDGIAVIGRYPGDVIRAGILTTQGVAAFDGITWRRVEAPSIGFTTAIARAPSSGMLDVYIARLPWWATDSISTSLVHVTPTGESWAYIPVWGTITTMVQYGGELWCAGDLRLRQSDSAGVTVASWDGARWTVRLRDLTVTAMVASATDLYAGGTMPDPEGGPGSGLARWDGSRWRSVGGGVGGNFVTAPAHVTALALQGSDLYVAGDFVQAGSRGIARWDGASWYGLGRGLTGDGIIKTLATRGSVLYAAGWFDALTDVDTSLGLQRVAARNIARWDNAYRRWTALGSGVDDTVNALAVWGSDLYVGGYFHTAGVNPSANIALWHDPLSPGSGVDARDAVAAALTPRIAPNPAREKTRIGFTLSRAAHARLSIVSSAGIEITTLVDDRLAEGEHVVSWDVSDIPGGVYFCRLRCDDRAENSAVVVVH